MNDYRITINDKDTIIERAEYTFKMRVQRNVKPDESKNTALMEATLYKEDGVFVKNSWYLFEALNKQNEPIAEVNVDEFNTAVDFFFNSLLGTEHYVKSIPRASSLCNAEMKSFKYE